MKRNLSNGGTSKRRGKPIRWGVGKLATKRGLRFLLSRGIGENLAA